MNVLRGMLQGVLLLCLPPSSSFAVGWDFVISTPLTGTTIIPGQPLTVKIQKVSEASPRVLSVMSDCFEEKAKSLSTSDKELTWDVHVRRDLDLRKVCLVTLIGFALPKEAPTRTILHTRPITLVPKRQLDLSHISIPQGWGVDQGACDSIPITGIATDGAALDVTFDPAIEITVADNTVADLKGRNYLEGRRAGSTTVTISYAPAGRQPVTANAVIAVDPSDNPRPPCLPSVETSQTLSSARSAARPTTTAVTSQSQIIITPGPNANTPSVKARRALGVFTWTGTPDKDGLIRIAGQQAASGLLKGDFLPGVPVKVTVTPADVVAAQEPAQSNGYQRLVLRSPRRQSTTITIQWETIQ